MLRVVRSKQLSDSSGYVELGGEDVNGGAGNVSHILFLQTSPPFLFFSSLLDKMAKGAGEQDPLGSDLHIWEQESWWFGRYCSCR